ncbi:MerR family transcriptional regulator [Bacillus chungangensis]|uniref:DNA-binding transcriptional MerR regulator n=1 Tax=Bacillus chungangensis TaxID=587633 RepID=A0ABT9WNH3_9BACI|nr:MerR family transcriptional regulator [Bacillus chungangensis]MDQ0174833.1 DNA-binding transcriptional MerR regulator [Bacillus chungangensis]
MISIKALSKKTGISTRTMRYYEEINLILPAAKDEAGMRYYSKENMIKLQQIRFLRSIGLRLKDIKLFLEQENDPVSLLHNQLQYVNEQMEQLKNMKRNIKQLLFSIEIEGGLQWELLFHLMQNNEASNIEKHYKEEIEIMEKLRTVNSQWIAYFKQIVQLYEAKTPPDSPNMQKICHELTEITMELFNGDKQKANQVWDMVSQPQSFSKLGGYPIRQEILQFLDDAYDIYEKQERNRQE